MTNIDFFLVGVLGLFNQLLYVEKIELVFGIRVRCQVKEGPEHYYYYIRSDNYILRLI